MLWVPRSLVFERGHVLINKVGITYIGELYKVFEIVIPSACRNGIALVNIQFGKQLFQQSFGHMPVVNKPYRRCYFPLFQPFRHPLYKAFRYVVVDIQLGITCNFMAYAL